MERKRNPGPSHPPRDSRIALRSIRAAKAERRRGISAPAPCSPEEKSLRGVEAGDRLDLEIFFHAVFAPLAAVAGLLVAAERRGAVVGHALQVDVAGTDLAADLARPLDGAGRDVTGEAVRRVV